MVDVIQEPLNLPPYHQYAASVLGSVMGAFRDKDDAAARVMMLKQINMACNMAKLINRKFDGRVFKRSYNYQDGAETKEITEDQMIRLNSDDLWDMMNYYNSRAGLTAKQEQQVPISIFNMARGQVGR